MHEEAGQTKGEFAAQPVPRSNSNSSNGSKTNSTDKGNQKYHGKIYKSHLSPKSNKGFQDISKLKMQLIQGYEFSPRPVLRPLDLSMNKN
jgi:hypothetical protein